MVLFLIICYSNCNYEKDDLDDVEVVYFRSSDQTSKFDHVFTSVDSFSFNFGKDTTRVLPAIWRLLVSNKGDLFTFNNGSIARFTSKGEFIEDIGSPGRGPGEFNSVTDYDIDQDDNIWVLDVAQLRVSIFKPDKSRYKFYDAFQTDGINVDKFRVIDSNFIGYSNYHDFLVTQYSSKGRKLNDFFQVEDARRRTFLARFNGGGICQGFVSNRFYAIYPGEYEIREFSIDSGLIKVYRNPSGDKSSFNASAPNFPDHLDPYDMTDQHKDWYESFLHIESVFTLDPDILGVIVFHETLGESRTTYINLYDTKGNSIAEGIRMPDHSRFAGGNKEFFYLAIDESMRADGSIKPMVIQKYKLNSELGI